jgi:hypothetical protein
MSGHGPPKFPKQDIHHQGHPPHKVTILTFDHHSARDLYEQLAEMTDDSTQVVHFIGSACLGQAMVSIAKSHTNLKTHGESLGPIFNFTNLNKYNLNSLPNQFELWTCQAEQNETICKLRTETRRDSI